MATLIGVVSQVVGEVFAVASDGSRRPISEGDRVYADEQLVTGVSGAVAVAMTNGQQLTLGRDSSITLDTQMIADRGESQAPVVETPPTAPSDDDLTDVERLQAAIEAGDDPTQEGEATAAGPGAGAGGAGGGHSFVMLGEIGGSLDPVIGFPTAGLPGGPEFPDPDPVIGFDEPEAANGSPEAFDDSNSIMEDAEGPIAGNVLANDDPGPDLPLSFVSWGSTDATYGVFTDTGGGTYTYALNNDDPRVQGLDDGESLTETFTYTIVDGNGDQDTATLTITIEGVNDIPVITISGDPQAEGSDGIVYESGLEPDGSQVSPSDTTATGNFKLGDADGLDDLESVTISGANAGTPIAIADLLGTTVQGAHGTLVITSYNAATGEGTYTYTLTSATMDVDGVAETDVFDFSVSDGTTSASASITIEIVDDVPVAVNDDGGTVVEDGLSSLSGDVLANDNGGADAPKAFVSWSSEDTDTIAMLNTYGSLTQNGDGTWSYELNNSLAATQALGADFSQTYTLNYTMKDADGDESSATLSITVKGSNDTPEITIDGDPDAEGSDGIVYESGLEPDGSQVSPSDTTATGNFKLGDADGLDDLESVTISGANAGTPIAIADLLGTTVQGAHGTVVITSYNAATGEGTYTYTLTSATMDVDGVAETDVFDFSVSDGTTSASASITIEIVDDVPTASDETVRPILDDEGLDGGINGGIGDTNGAETKATGTLNFSAGADGLQSLELTGPDTLGSEAVTSTWSGNTLTITSAQGRGDLLTVQVDPATGEYTVSLLKPLRHEEGDHENNIHLSIGYTVTDGDGDSTSATIRINIDDDTPTISQSDVSDSSYVTFMGSDAGYANSYGYYIKSPDGTPLSGKVIWANVLDLDIGDEASLDGLNPEDVGFFIIPDGAENDDLSDGAELTFEFDGEKWHAVLDGVRLEGADGANVLFSDASLNPGGAHLQDTDHPGNQNWEDKTDTSDFDYNDVSVSVTWGGQLQVDETRLDVDAVRDFSGIFNVDAGADGQRSLTYDLTLEGSEGGPVNSGLVDMATGEPVFLRPAGTSTIEGRTADGKLVFTVSVDSAGVVTLDQQRALKHPSTDPDEPIGLGANLVGLRATVTDNDGDSASSTLDLGKLISFKDDGPTANNDDPDALVEGESVNVVSGNVLGNDSAGADGGKAFVGWNSSPANAAAIAELEKYGLLELDQNTGEYTFTLNNNDPDTLALAEGQLVSEKLQYTMRDADGDISTAFLTIRIVGTNNGITLEGLDVGGGEVTVDEQHLPNGSAPDEGALTQPGTFSFESPDGLDTIKIGNQEFTLDQLQGATAGAPLVIESAGGVLNITGFTGSANGGTVNYAYTLENAVGHAAVQGPNTLTEQFEVVVTDRDGDSESGFIDVTIIDDVPNAKDNKVCIEGPGLPPYNLSLVLDSSESMNDRVWADLNGDNTPESVTRLDVAKAAMVNLIDSYVALGVPLNFKVIDFDSTARLLYEGVDPAAAKAAINSMNEGGYTNYQAALNLARTELQQDLANSSLDDYENRLYFLSDGEPYPSGNGAPANWQDFVDENGIDVIAVGIQIPTGGAAENALEAVGNDGDSVIVVTDPNELSATLDDTVPDAVTGNVISDVGTDGVDVAGADGALSVTSVTYQDADGNSQTVSVPAGGTTGPLETLLGGTLTMSSDGTYTYNAPANVSGDSEDVFTYTVKDADGDTDSANLTICIKDSVPLAKDNEATVVESGLPPYNLTLVLDSSGSMDDIVKADLDGDGSREDVTRLDVAKVAMINLIDSYIALGVPLNFKVIDFDSSARLVYEGSDLVAAKNAINAMDEGGNTNYTAALNLARGELEDDLTNPALADYENRLYFLSDGAPYPSSNGVPSGWQSFVDNNGIDVVAVGIQVQNNSNALNQLGQVGNAGDTVVVVTDPNELSATLTDTVPDSLEGNVIIDAGPDGVDDAGTDGPISVVFVSYTNATGDLVTVAVPESGSTGPLTTELGGTLVIASDGSYTYSAPRNAPTGAQDVFKYTIADRDGDTSSANLTITIEDGGPVAKDDNVQAQEGYWMLAGNSTYTAQYGSITNVSLNNLDIDNAPNMGEKSSQSSNFTLTAHGGAPAKVIFSASTGNWDSADRWDAELFRVGDSNPVAQLLNQTGSRSNASFDSITQSGQYYVKFTVRDNSPGSNNSRADLDITKLQYTNPLQNVSVTVPGMVWIAALAASGNVLSNDNPGPDGGLAVTGVNGQNMEAGGLSLLGQYGTLHIAASGTYTYIPLTGDLPSGASDSFTYDIVDADGSTDNAVLTVGIKDYQYSSTGNSGHNLVSGNEGNNTLDGQGGNDVVYGGAGNDTLHGGTGNDHLMGGDGNDILFGGSGNDLLNGGAGNDKLYGGSGNDWLIGGEGEDIFIWGAGESGIDVVADFQAGPNGDVLDLSALLTGENAGNLESYLTFAFGPSTTIIADSNGASSGGNIQTIVLDGVDLGTFYGTSSTGEVIAKMLDDGSLVVNS